MKIETMMMETPKKQKMTEEGKGVGGRTTTMRVKEMVVRQKTTTMKANEMMVWGTTTVTTYETTWERRQSVQCFDE